MSVDNNDAPSFYKRSASAWVDVVLLIGAYIIVGFLFRHIFDKDAYPRPTGMQLYSERDFVVYWFFVKTTVTFVILYMIVCYQFFGVTLGQKLARIHYVSLDQGKPSAWNIVRRILTVLFKVFIVFFPGPIVAFLFVAFSSEWLNPAFSMLLLMVALLGILYASITRYNRGATRAWSDRFSGTLLVNRKSLVETAVEQRDGIISER